ncbi:MAG: integrase arm-type DNA-binding domain-containing protein [Desulfovibrio sp.]|nr:integrase arm-type DNA-binding domain-containing protein [Desulfovibrio sp.]
MLTDFKLRSLKANGKVQKVFDGEGLFILVTEKGSKLWRLAYRFDGKQKTLCIGSYPEMSLSEAREAKREAKQLLSKGVDPAAQKKQEKSAKTGDGANNPLTFRAVGREWYENKTQEREPRYRKLIRSRLENNLFPFLGDIPVDMLKPQDILAPARALVSRGHVDAAHRVMAIAGQVCRYARLCGYCTFNPADGLQEALPTAQHTRRAAITDPEEVGHLLVAIDECRSDVSIRYILKLLPYVFL